MGHIQVVSSFYKYAADTVEFNCSPPLWPVSIDSGSFLPFMSVRGRCSTDNAEIVEFEDTLFELQLYSHSNFSHILVVKLVCPS